MTESVGRSFVGRVSKGLPQRGTDLVWRSCAPLMRRGLRRSFSAAPLAAKQHELSVILTSAGRGDLLERTVTSLRENLQFDGRVRWMVIDDLPHEATRRYIHSQPFDVVIYNDRNVGLGRSLTRIYSVLETRWFFHCEDDWDFLRPFDVEKMQTLMEREADLGQLVLHREEQRGSSEVIERGGYVEYPPFFSLNPHLGRFDTLIQGFPFERRSAEVRLTRRMRALGIRTGIYGWGDEPFISHTGEERMGVRY
jgi:hypothetical protein